MPDFKKGHYQKYPQIPIINYKSANVWLSIKNIDDFLLSNDFSIILCEKGNAIAFGKNTNGQLGLAHKKEAEIAKLIPQFKHMVETIKKRKI